MHLSGSFAKGTATALGTDIDIFVSLKPWRAPERSAWAGLDKIYWSLFRYCAERNLQPEAQNVSIRVRMDGAKIDLVPARKQPGTTQDHSLYKRKSNTWMQTNVDEHIRW
jgi:tRNA nucleotidyltransferase (CCA-adding enzyme)